jgi:hypothetical protein
VGVGTRGVVLGKSHDVDTIEDADNVLNTGLKDNGGVSGKKGYVYSSSCSLIQILCIFG